MNEPTLEGTSGLINAVAAHRSEQVRNSATLATVAAGGRQEERTADHATGAAEQPSACGVVGHS